MGRPTKLTPEIHTAIVTAVKLGAYKAVAARAVGVHPRTLERWLEKGTSEKPVEPYATFADDLENAEGECEMRMIASVQKAVKAGDMKATTWFLERRFPDRWGPKSEQRIQHEGAAVTFYLPDNGRDSDG